MRYLLLLIWLGCQYDISSQSLDEIISREQAEELLKNKFRYYNLKYSEFKIKLDTTGKFDSFQSGDFDFDGGQDLLIYGSAEVVKKKRNYSFDEIVILLGNNRHPIKAYFSDRFFTHWIRRVNPIPKIIKVDNRDYIQLKYTGNDFEKDTVRTYFDTIFVSNERIIPYSGRPDKRKIKKIEFRTTHCYGSCPVFELGIHKNLEVSYNGIDFVKEKGN